MCFGTRILPVKSPPKKNKNKVVQKNKTIDSCVIKDALGVINYPIYIYSLKDILVRARLPKTGNVIGKRIGMWK